MKHSWADWWLCRGEYCRCWKMSLLKIRICTPAAVWWIVSKHKVERSSLVCCSAVSEMMCVSDGCWIKAVYILGFWLLSVSSAVQTPQELPGAILHLAHSSVVFYPVQQFMSMVCKRSRVSLFLIFFLNALRLKTEMKKIWLFQVSAWINFLAKTFYGSCTTITAKHSKSGRVSLALFR